MIELKCKSCGANLSVEEDREFGFCQYCGAKYILKESVNVNLNVKIDNNNDNKIEMAFQKMSEGNFEKAEKIAKQVLEDDIKNHRAWWIRYLCETYYSKYYGYVNRYGETSIDIKKSIIRKNLEYAYKAIENAQNEEDINYYKEKISEDERFVGV